MAILSKIRQRSFILIVVIALALFAFVLGDLINSGSFSTNSRFAGIVDGENVMAQDFQYRVALAEQQGMSNAQASNGVWEQEVKRIIFSNQYDKLGLKLSADQLINVMKENPNLANNPQFLNEAGKFDEAKFQEFVKTMLSSPNSDQKKQWLAFEDEAEKNFLEQTYYTMIKAGIQSTKAEGKQLYEEENEKVDFGFVSLPYSTINDDEVKVSDDEIIAYMKENKKKFKSDKTVDLELVLIENTPSKADEAEMKKNLDIILSGGVMNYDTIPSFKNATDVAAYVNKNSDIKYDSTYINKKDLPLEYQEQLFNLATGEVFGPYIDNGYQKVSKMMAKKANTSAKASHILIAYKDAMRADPSITRTKEEAKTLADNLLSQAKANPANFATLAIANTDDPGSKQNGGEYDNIAPNKMVKPFNDYIFNNPIGSIGVVETEFGYHVIKVSDKYNSVQLATVAQKVQPSEETSGANYAKATKFEIDAAKDLEKASKEMGYNVTPANGIKSSDEYLPVGGAQRGIVLWAYNKDTDVNDVKRFEVSNGHIIAKLKAVNDTGLMSVELAKSQVEPILKNKKKAEKIKAKMTGKTLEEVSKSSKASIITSTGSTMNNGLITNVGPEPKVVGKAFALAPGKTSDLIEGNTGVFMIKTKAVTKAPAIPNYTNYITQAQMQTKGASVGRVLSALKEKAEIEDLRVQ